MRRRHRDTGRPIGWVLFATVHIAAELASMITAGVDREKMRRRVDRVWSAAGHDPDATTGIAVNLAALAARERRHALLRARLDDPETYYALEAERADTGERVDPEQVPCPCAVAHARMVIAAANEDLDGTVDLFRAFTRVHSDLVGCLVTDLAATAANPREVALHA